MKHWIAIALFVVGLTGCKQGLGDRCQVNSDCASNHCTMSDPQVCVTAEGNSTGDIDATVPDPSDAPGPGVDAGQDAAPDGP